MLKRSLSLLLVVIMLCNMLPLSALADENDLAPDGSTRNEDTYEDQGDHLNGEEAPSVPDGEAQTDPAVQAVQDMIDALVIPDAEDPAYQTGDNAADQAAYEADLAELEEALDAIDEAGKDFTEEQNAQIDDTQYTLAWKTINEYWLAKLPATIAEEDGWYWEDSTLYILDGKIQEKNLYAAILMKQTSASAIKYATSKPSLGWGLGGTELSSSSTTELSLSGSYAAGCKTGRTWFSGIKDVNFTVVSYYLITAGENVTLDDDYVTQNQVVNVTVPHVEGQIPSATYNNSNVALTQDGDFWTGTITAVASGEVAVTYKSADAEKYPVNVTVVGAGTAAADVSEGTAGTIVTITATPTDSGVSNVVNYLGSIAVNGNMMAGNTFTIGEENANVVVTFKTDSITLKEGTYEAAVNTTTYADLTADKIIEAAVAESSGNVTVQFRDYDKGTIGLGGHDSWADLTEANLATFKDSEDKNTFKLICGKAVAEIQVTFKDARADANVELNDVFGDVLVNGHYGPEDEGLAQRVYDAIVKTSEHDGAWTVTVYDGGTLNGWRELDSVLLTTSNFAPGQSKQFRITWDGTDTYNAKTIEVSGVKLVESRKAPTITLDETKIGAYDTKADFEAAVKAAITATAGTVSVTFPSDYTFPGTVTVTAKVTDSGATWIAGGDTTFTVTGVVNTYTITWVDGNGNTLETDENVAYGATPEYNGATPTKNSTVDKVYTWNNGWDKEIAAVTGDVTYTATFTEAARAYTISWDTNGDGTVDETTQVAYGTVPTAPAHADRSSEDLSPNGWSPAIVAVTGEATYTAQYSNDTVYTVKFLVDGAEYDVQYVNVTQGQTVTVPAAPDKDYAVFGGWDKEIVTAPTADAVYTATWLTDANNNNVVDTEETVTVTADVIGSGTVDLVANDNITVTKTAEGWTVLYNSKVDGANVVAVTAAPNDTVNTDGSVDYLISCDETIDLKTDTVINAAFGTESINVAENGTVYINGNLTEITDKVKGLKEKVLTAAGITDDAANYTVSMVTGTGTYDVTTTKVLEQIAMAAFFNVGDTQGFVVQKNSEYVVSDTISIKVEDSRLKLTITADPAAYTKEAKEGNIDSIKAEIKALFTITTTNPATGEVLTVNVSDSYIDWDDLAWPADGETKTFTVKVKVNTIADAAYQNAPSASVTVTLKDTTILYKVTYLDGYNTENNVVAEYTIAENLAMQTPADPTREYYTFAGWTPAVAETVTSNVTYTATWTAETDVNGNKIADEEEKYTVVYVLGNGEENKTFADLAWGAATPVYDANADEEGVQDPTREGYNFKGWDVAPAATVCAPASGNTITYTAQWTQAWAVKFMDRGQQYGEGVEVENGNLLTEPETPVWDEDHDFLGWYNGTVKYIFENPVTSNLTLTAKWREDFNRNDTEDATESHFNVTYNVDGVLTTFEKVLVNMPTPAYDADPETEGSQNPTKKDYKFSGWQPEVAETVTGYVTYVAQWLNDANNNGVDDALETITINVIKAAEEDQVTVTGAEALEDGKYLFDSTKEDKTVTIQAVPATTGGVLTEKISASYVASIAVNETAAELEYAKDYSVIYGFTPEGSQVVTVGFAPAAFVYNEERVMNYYPGMENVSNETVYKTIVETPALPGDYTITYKAREAMSQTVNLLNLVGDNDILKRALQTMKLDTITIDMPVLWLDVNVETDEGLIKDSVSLDQAVAEELTIDDIEALWDLFDTTVKANGGYLSLTGIPAGTKAVETRINEIVKTIESAAMYYNAHNFGYNPTDAETVTEVIKITYGSTAMYIEGESTIDLKDLRAPSYLKGSNVSAMYRDYTDEELVALINPYLVNADGETIEGTLTALDITDPYTLEGKSVSDTAYELTFKFAGDKTYKPSEGTFTVTVTKAGAAYDAPNTIVTYGESYAMLSDSTITLTNKYGEKSELINSMVQFVIGLDAADFAVDAEGNVTGLDSRIQIILPDELKSILDAIQSITGGNVQEGITLSLNDLLKYLEVIPETSLDFLNQALEAIAGIANAGELQIVLGGDLPKDTGAYLYGAVSTSSNYETAYDVSYILIKPNASQVYLDWNYKDTNGIFTYDLVRAVSMGASAYDDAAFTIKNETATAKINNLIFGLIPTGIDSETKEPTFELKLALYDAYGHNTTEMEKDLPLGAYTQLAFIGDFGNEMVYGLPIVRAFVLAPNPVSVEIGDSQDTNKAIFTNQPAALDVTVSYTGSQLVINKDLYLKMTYTGVQTNGKVYGPTAEAPVHAGAYVVTATYLHEADGQVVSVGADVEALLIEPAASSVEVADKTETLVPGQTYSVKDMITAASAVDGLTPDVTVMTANLSVNAEGTAISGGLNVDLPAWLDQLLKDKNLLQSGEINVQTLLNALTKVETAVGDLITEESILNKDQILNSLNALKGVLGNLSADIKVTLRDDVAPSEAGVYLVAAAVTDSDHYPSLDAGVMILAPEHQQYTLAWNAEDINHNHVFMLETIKMMDMDAHTVEDAELDPVEIFVGTDTNNWNLMLTRDKNNLTLGSYTEIAFLLDGNGQQVSYAEPISRTFVVVPGEAKVTFVDEIGQVNHDRLFTYDGQPHGIGRVLIDGSENTGSGTLKIVYAGMDLQGKVYNSETAPTNAGIYNVTAVYTLFDENGTFQKGGAAVGTLVIQQADLALDMKDTTVTYDAKEHFVDVTSNNQAADYLSVIVDKQTDTVNILLEDDATLAGTLLKTKLEEALGKSLSSEFDARTALEAIHKAIDEVQAIQIPDELMAIADKLPEDLQKSLLELEQAKAQLDEILAAVEQALPNNGKIIFNGKLPVDVGTYQFYGLALSANYHPEATQGVLTIEKRDATITLDDQSKVYGQTDPELTYTVEGLVNGDDLNIVVSRAAGEDVGTYAITAAAEHANYNITVVDGELTIRPKAITEADVALDGSLTYDGTEQTQAITVADGITYTVTGNKATNAGDYTLTVTGTGNYTGTVELDWRIAKAQAVITVDTTPITVTYGEAVTLPIATSNFGTVICDKTAADLVNAGDYTVTYTVEGTNNYHGDTKTISVTVNKANPTVTAPAAISSLVNTGSAQTLITAGATTGGQMLYSLDGINYSADLPEATDAGTYTVSYKVVGDSNYEDAAAQSLTVTIAKAQAVITVNTTPITVTYGETVILPIATSNFGTVICDKTAADLVNAGTYTVTYTVAGTDNYHGDTKTISVTVNKANPTVTAPVAISNLVYTGSAQTLITAGATTGGQMLYSLDSIDYSADLPEATDAGIYTVSYKVVGDSNYEDAAAQSLTVTIAKAKVEKPTENDAIFTYTGKEQTYSIPANSLYTVTGNTRTDAGSQTVTVALKDTANYEWTDGSIADVTFPFTIGKATVTEPIIGSKVYTGSALTATVTEDDLYIVTTNAGGIHVGSYVVVLTLADSSNYQWSTTENAAVTLLFQITAATNEWTTDPAISGWTYGETASTPTGAAKFGTVEYTWYDSAKTKLDAQPTNAGTYYMVASVAADGDNYAAISSDYIGFTIAKAQAVITVDTKDITVTYGETVILPTATSNFGTVICDTTVEELVNAGVYTVTYTVADTDNYAGATEMLTVTIRPKAITEADVALDGSLTYHGTKQTQAITVAAGITYTVAGNEATDAGSYTLTVTGTGNYTGTVKRAWSIVQKSVTITLNHQSKVYGEIDPELTYTVEGLVDGDDLNIVVSRAAGVDAGTYAITAAAENANYNINIVNSELTIAPKAVTVTLDNKTMVLGEAMPDLTYSVEGLLEGDALNVTPKCETYNNREVGSYDITATVVPNANYEVTIENGNLTVTPKAVTVTLDDKTVVLGEAMPELTYSVEGLLEGDELSVTPSCAAKDTRTPGTFPITAAYEENPNYTVTVQNAVLTVVLADREYVEINLEVGETVTVTQNGLPEALGDEDITIINDSIVSVDMTVTKKTTGGSHWTGGWWGSWWGNWGGNWGGSSGKTTYDHTITFTGEDAGVTVVQVGDVWYKVTVTAPCAHTNCTSVVTQPTCTEKGYTTYTCGDCGYSWTADETSALDHNYSAVVTDPTCTDKGYTTYTCLREGCGHSYVGDYVDATGHTFDENGVCHCGETRPNNFTPRKFTASISRSSVNVGKSATITVKTSTDVEYVTINGVKVDTYKDTTSGGWYGWGNKTTTRTFTYTVTEQAAGTYQYEILAFNAAGAQSDVSRTVKLTVKAAGTGGNGWWIWWK